MFYSPLRYPGGKNKLSAFLAQICIDNEIDGHYVEPYCGGASVALFLLMEGYVDKITINDKDRSIYAFWHSVLNKNKQLCKLIEKVDVSIEEWYRQFEVQKRKKKVDLLTLGFSTFFLNRTNRSGIISARPIGGMKQDGDYKIHERFNKKELITRIKRIGKVKSKIRLYKKDALRLIDKIENEQDKNTIFYFDPPYYLKASSLYLNHYKTNNHKEVSQRIREIKNIKWIVSYDNVDEINKLYRGLSKKEFTIRHSSNKFKVGREVLFFSPWLKKPKIENWNPLNFKLNRNRKVKCIQYHVI